jgi:hypothetical protein
LNLRNIEEEEQIKIVSLGGLEKGITFKDCNGANSSSAAPELIIIQNGKGEEQKVYAGRGEDENNFAFISNKGVAYGSDGSDGERELSPGE